MFYFIPGLWFRFWCFGSFDKTSKNIIKSTETGQGRLIVLCTLPTINTKSFWRCKLVCCKNKPFSIKIKLVNYFLSVLFLFQPKSMHLNTYCAVSPLYVWLYLSSASGLLIELSKIKYSTTFAFYITKFMTHSIYSELKVRTCNVAPGHIF